MMKKNLFPVFLRLAALAACIYACVLSVRLATGDHGSPALVGVVGPAEPISYLDTAAFAESLAELDCEVRVSDAGISAADAALQLIEQGAEVIVIGSDVPFTDPDVFTQAAAHSTTLLFVGASPQQKLLNSYDKAWALDNDAAHGGQLLGKQAAMAFREGSLQDVDDDKLLDCIGLLPGDYPSAGIVGREFLAECEHYGVYTDLHHNFTDVTADLHYSLNEVWQRDAQPADALEDDSAGDVSDTSQPEVIFCAGSRAAELAHEQARQMGWLGTTRIAALAESRESAQALRDAGTADYIAYYDRETATSILSQFTHNALNYRFVAQDCTVQPDENKHFIFGYQLLE